MDLNRDELRRELKAIDADNKAIMPKWYDALRQIVGGGTKMSTDEKAALLGVPSPGRRQLFKLGGATIIGAAVLAACGDDDDERRHHHDRRRRRPTARASDATWTCRSPAPRRRSRSWPSTPTRSASTPAWSPRWPSPTPRCSSRRHHQAHLDALNGAIKDAGGEEVTEANAGGVRRPGEAGRRRRRRPRPTSSSWPSTSSWRPRRPTPSPAARSARPALRSTIMTIGGIEARHAAVLQVAAQAAAPLTSSPTGLLPRRQPPRRIDGAVLSA